MHSELFHLLLSPDDANMSTHHYKEITSCPKITLILFMCVSLFVCVPLQVTAQKTVKKKARVAVMIFAKDGASERIRATVERDLRNMISFADAQKKVKSRLYPIEPFFDVGQLSKANLHKAQRHFNEAQRAIEANDYSEAKDQLFRARLFYLKGVPYIYNGNEELLQSIFYFDYITHKNLKQKKKSRDLYCNYVSLSRNIAGSVGPIEQYESLAELCEQSPISGTAELKLTSNLDGAHVYINNKPVGLVDKNTPHMTPFMPAGVHLVEVRKIGYARWGKLVTLENGKSKKLKARLKRAKNYNQDYLPLASLPLRGAEAFSDTYLTDFFFERIYRYRVDTLLIGYIESIADSKIRLSMITFRDEMLEPRFEATFPAKEHNGHFQALETYWNSLFGFSLNPGKVKSVQTRWMPTFFKVE